MDLASSKADAKGSPLGRSEEVNGKRVVRGPTQAVTANAGRPGDESDFHHLRVALGFAGKGFHNRIVSNCNEQLVSDKLWH